MPIYRDTRLAAVREPATVEYQLSLIPPSPTSSMPLREALEQYADAWSRRVGYEVRVVELSNGCGYRIEPNRGA